MAIPKDYCEDFVIVCGAFVVANAAVNKKIYDFNYEATKSLQRTTEPDYSHGFLVLPFA